MVLVAVPISARDPAALAAVAARAKAAGADLVEVRLDTCIGLGADPRLLLASMPALALPVILTIRHASEGGEWSGGDDERMALFGEAVGFAPAYLDIELAHWPRFLAAGFSREALSSKLILSYHDFEGPGDDLPGKVAAMRAAGAHVAKVAIRPRDAADLALIAELYEQSEGPLIALAMGEHGLPSRLLAGVWGAHLTFARLADEGGSAPGQPTVDELLGLYRLRQQGPRTRIFGVIGSPVAQSLSPLIHNIAFAHLKIDAVYVPFRVEDAAGFWRACGAWLSGLSITIPHKQALIGLMTGVEDLAARIGAINTVYRDRDLRPLGANTDALAVTACLVDHLGSLYGRRVLVLGAGGVSRAIAFAAREGGAAVTIANRSLERARELAGELGCEAVELDKAYGLPFDVLVNGSAAGMGQPDETPWPASAHKKGTVVFDTVYHPLETRLLKDAQLAGAHTICGLEMLIGQALGQFQRWTGVEAPAHLMYRAVLDRLGQTTRH